MGLAIWLSLCGMAYGIAFPPPNSAATPSRMWYTAASVNWNDSLLIGNGRLGGAIWGTVSTEKVSLNEATIWTGGPLHRINADSNPTYNKVSAWIVNAQISQAQYEAQLGLSGTPSSQRQYQPGGDLQLVFANQSGSVTNYERWLDLADATTGVYYTAGKVTYQREYLSSTPAGVIALRLTASSPGAISFYTRFQRPANGQNRYVDTSYASRGNHIYSTFQGEGLQYVFGAVVHNIGGSMRQIGDTIEVTGADEVWIYVDIETSVSHPDPLGVVTTALATALKSTYSAIRAAHVADYQSFYNRTSVSLGASSNATTALSTGARQKAIGATGVFDAGLVSLYFQFGRYLLISSSRAGGLPPNLQGIWNNQLDPAWGSKFTININLEMNYWPSEITNLGDLTEPLWTLMDKMQATGRQTAKAIYKAGGWCCHHNTDLWGDSAPQDIYAQGAYWPMGGAWLVTHIFEHYRFSGDRAFLESKYDIIHGAVEFYHTFLEEYKGWMVTNPSVSPENNYVNGSSSSSGAMTVGSTIDNSILWELFSILDQAAVILKKPVNPFITKTRLLRSQLPPLRVSPTTGGIMEWIADFKESDPGHRHMSHLWGLFPGNEITAANQTLFTAAKNSVVRRLQNAGGSTGWSRAWIINLWARLLDGSNAELNTLALLANYTYPSLMDTGPPAAWQIDGNFGGAAGIAESLLQSHTGTVVILPALFPSANEGHFSGLVARGGFVVSAQWSGGLLQNATVLSKIGNKLAISVGTNQTISVQGQAGSNTTLYLSTKAGKSYNIDGGDV